MGTSSENFCLRWNDFESNVSGAFRDLRAESDFFDVTLGCAESGKSLQAHKVILSACSSTFKQMLRDQARSSPHPHPYIFLRGVSFCDLSAVLDFMYHGEVNVAQEDLNSFLAVAEELQIKGLTQKEGAEPSKTSSSTTPKAPKRPVEPSSAPSSSGVKRARTRTPDQDVKAIDIKTDPEAGPSGSQQAVSASASGAGGGSEYADESADFEDYGDYYGDDNGEGGGGAGADGSMMEGGEDGAGGKEQDEADGITRINGSFICMRCGYKTKYGTTARRHYRTQHLPQKPASCHICQKQFRNSVYRDHHRAQEHGITRKMMKEAAKTSKIPLAPFADES